MHWTGLDPFTLEPVTTVKRMRDRNVQRALMQFFEPANWFTVRDALIEAGRKDLIGEGPECLIPSNPPRAALQARRDEASSAGERTARKGYRGHGRARRRR
jgi:hypothetical protein